MKTIYIAPAVGDLTGQCRIYATATFSRIKDVRDDYRERPHQWHEVGLMNAQGRLVCFDGTDAERQELLDCVPLSAGMYFDFE